jgi:hypothetical protein
VCYAKTVSRTKRGMGHLLVLRVDATRRPEGDNAPTSSRGTLWTRPRLAQGWRSIKDITDNVLADGLVRRLVGAGLAHRSREAVSPSRRRLPLRRGSRFAVQAVHRDELRIRSR